MPHRDPAKEKFWRRLLRQWRRSGLTAHAFCLQQGIRAANFYSWRREIARRDGDQDRTPRPDTPAFLQVDLEARTPATIDIVLGDCRLLRVRPGFDADLLRQLLRLLEEPSCCIVSVR